MAEFKDRLNEAMQARNMTAAELSRLSGVNEGAISQYRTGKYKASQKSLDKLAQTMNVSIPWLMGVEGVDMESHQISKNKQRLLEMIEDFDDEQSARLIAFLESLGMK